MARICRLTIGAIAAALLFSHAADAQSPAEVARERAKNGIVMLKSQHANAPGIFGAGIIVGASDQDVYIVTAEHLVRRIGLATSVQVQFRPKAGAWYPARILDVVESGLDLRVLQVRLPDGLTPSMLTGMGAAPSTALVRGTDVFPVGYRLERPWSDPVAADKLMSITRNRVTFQSSFVGPGNSGGALLDTCGRIVGMVVGTDPPEAEALRIETLLDTLKGWSLPATFLAGQPSGCGSGTASASPRAAIIEIRDMHAKERWAESLPVLSGLIQEQPANAELFALRSHAYSHLGRGTEALRDGEQAVAIAPKMAEAYVRRGEAKMIGQRLPDAIADFDRALELNKKDAEAWANKGATYLAMNRSDKALESYDRALDLQKARADFWWARAAVHSSLNNHAAAINDLTQAIRLRPANAAYYLNRARAYAAARQHEPALRDVNQALKLNADDPETLAVRASIYIGLGRREAAREDLHFAQRLQPDLPYVKELLKELERGAKGNAIDVPPVTVSRNDSRAADPTSRAYARLFDDANAALRSRRYAEATDLMEEMVKLDPSRSEAWTLKGVLAFNLTGNIPSAHENFENSLSRGGTIYFRVGHDHGNDDSTCLGQLSIGPQHVEFSGEGKHQFEWTYPSITKAAMNALYGAQVNMFHLKVQTGRREETFNFVVFRSAARDVLGRSADAELVLGFVNRMRRSAER